MMIQINTEDPRSVKSLLLAAEAQSWARLRMADGSTGFGVPSSADPSHYYVVTEETCSCPSAKYGDGRACKHIAAVRLHNALAEMVNAKPAPQPESAALTAI